MSEKNRDNKNRWRNVTIAFRMSPEENEELNLRVKLCGYQTRQEYIIESVLHQKVTAVGNPLMLVQFRKQLRGIEEELKRLTTLEDADEELFTKKKKTEQAAVILYAGSQCAAADEKKHLWDKEVIVLQVFLLL